MTSVFLYVCPKTQESDLRPIAREFRGGGVAKQLKWWAWNERDQMPDNNSQENWGGC